MDTNTWSITRACSNIHQGLKQRSILKLSQFGVDGGKVFFTGRIIDWLIYTFYFQEINDAVKLIKMVYLITLDLLTVRHNVKMI